MASSASSQPLRALHALIVMGLAIGFFFVPTPTPAHAASVVGAGTAASCSEQALKNAVAAGGAISFNCGPAPVTITVTSNIVITRDADIDGGGAVTLSGGGSVRVMKIESATVTLRNLTFRDGFGGQGGALRVMFYADVTILNCTFLNNSSNWGYEEEGGGAISIRTSKLTIRNSHFEGNMGVNGGAIYSLLTPLTIENSTFINNDSTRGGQANGSFNGGFGAGGAISTDGASYPKGNAEGGAIIIRNSVFRGNRAAGAGGAAFTYAYPPADRVIIEGSIFEDNTVARSAIGAAGGGAIRHGGGPLHLSGSLFARNRAGSGGAIWASRADGTRIENVTFANNEVHTSDRRGQGGALYLSTGSFDLVNTTIVKNYADYFAGAIFAESDNVALWNTIVAHNSANDGTRWNQCGRTLSRGGNNIMFPQGNGNNSGDYLCSPGISHSDPRLGALGDYGGLTPTVELLAGSPAINAGASCPSADQRGAARVGACDIGAFEYGGVPPGTSPPAGPPTLQSVASGNGPILNVSWSNVDGATRYEVEINGGTLSSTGEVVSVAGNSMSGIYGRGTYSVRVRACNYFGCSGYSSSGSATITSDPLRLFAPLVVR